MIIYLSLYFAIILIGIFTFCKGTSDRKKKVFLGIVFGLMILVMGFRDKTVGTDTILYCNIFKHNITFEFSNILGQNDFTFLYSLYNHLLSFLSHDSSIIILFNSGIIIYLTLRFIYKNSDNVVISILLFMLLYHFFHAMNISRQYIAVMIIANAYEYLKSGKSLKFAMWVCIATLIHNTSLIAFALIPLAKLKNKKQKNIFLLVFAIVCLFWNNFFAMFTNIFTHYSMYMDSSFIDARGENKKIIITFIYFLFQVIYLVSKSKINDIEEKKKMDMLYYINWIAILIGICSTRTLLLSRIEVYFSIFNIIFIPKVINLQKDKVIYYYILLILLMIPMIFLLYNGISGVIPYSNILFK